MVFRFLVYSAITAVSLTASAKATEKSGLNGKSRPSFTRGTVLTVKGPDGLCDTQPPQKDPDGRNLHRPATVVRTSVISGNRIKIELALTAGKSLTLNCPQDATIEQLAAAGITSESWQEASPRERAYITTTEAEKVKGWQEASPRERAYITGPTHKPSEEGAPVVR